MPIARIGYGTDFILENQAVGVATDTSDRTGLYVGGTTKANYNISGIASLSNYAGFAAAEQSIDGTVTLTGEHSTLGDIVVGLGSTAIISTGSTVEVGTVPSVSIGTHFSPPKGDINDRPEVPVEGMVRFNIDLNTLEFYNGVEWRQFTVSGQSGRAVVTGGVAPGSDYTDAMQLFNIHTLGNAINFGSLINGGRFCIGRSSSSTRGIIAGGQEGPSTPRDFIDYITIASAGDSQDFGDLSSAGRCFGGASSSTRGIVGCPNASNTANAVEIATLGSLFNTYVNFGLSGGNKTAQFSSPIKLISNSGEGTGASRGTGSPIQNVTVEQVIIATGGETTAWGELTRATRQKRGTSNSVRGIFAGGYDNYSPYPNVKIMDYINIESEGVAVRFGDLTEIKNQMACMSSPTRSVFAGGSGTPTTVNTIEYVNIASTGNGQDFGDLTKKVSATNGLSDCHGGLGGY